MSIAKLLLAVLLMTTSFTLIRNVMAQEDNPVELGAVNWGRSIEEAQAKSKESGKPLFVQFQEVPG